MTETLIDKEKLKRFVGNDSDLSTDLAVTFHKSLPSSLSQLQVSILGGDDDEFCSVMHRLKSQLSYFFCDSLIDQAKELESMGQQGKIDEVQPGADELVSNIENLLEELSELTGLQLTLNDD